MWQGGTVTELRSLGGADTSGVAINARGQVTGWSTTATGDHHAFLWERGKMTDLGTLGGKESTPTSINANGEVVGSSETANVIVGTGRVRHAFLWRDGAMQDLGMLDEGTPSGASGVLSPMGDISLAAGAYFSASRPANSTTRPRHRSSSLESGVIRGSCRTIPPLAASETRSTVQP